MKNLLIVAALSLVVISGCSKSKSTPTTLVVDESLPHGIWTLDTTPANAFAARARTNVAQSGKVIVTPTQIIEYYDFDGAQDCSVNYTDRYVTDWNSATGVYANGSVSTTLSASGNAMTLLFTEQPSGEQHSVKLKYASVYSTNTQAQLDAEWCGPTGVDPVVSTIDGTWLRTYASDEEFIREQYDSDGEPMQVKRREMVQLVINNFEWNATTTAREYYLLNISYFDPDGSGERVYKKCSTSREITYNDVTKVYRVLPGHSGDDFAVSNVVSFGHAQEGVNSLYIGGHDDGNTIWKRIPTLQSTSGVSDCSVYDKFGD